MKYIRLSIWTRSSKKVSPAEEDFPQSSWMGHLQTCTKRLTLSTNMILKSGLQNPTEAILLLNSDDLNQFLDLAATKQVR